MWTQRELESQREREREGECMLLQLYTSLWRNLLPLLKSITLSVLCSEREREILRLVCVREREERERRERERERERGEREREREKEKTRKKREKWEEIGRAEQRESGSGISTCMYIKYRSTNIKHMTRK